MCESRLESSHISNFAPSDMEAVINQTYIDQMVPRDECFSCNREINFTYRYPCVLNCGHIICQPCREKSLIPSFNDRGQCEEIIFCNICDCNRKLNSDQLNKYVDLMRAS